MTSDDTSSSASEPSSGYSRGEGQKTVTQAYKDNWNAIFGKKPAAKKATKKAAKAPVKKAAKKTAKKAVKKTAPKKAKKTKAKARKKR